MIDKDKLRKGNYVRAFIGIGSSNFNYTIVRVDSIDGDGISHWIDYPDSECLEGESSSYETIHPVPLNDEWKTLLKVDFEYPSWIKHVHELQNWYYWSHKKTELDVSGIPMTEGDNVQKESLLEILN